MSGTGERWSPHSHSLPMVDHTYPPVVVTRPRAQAISLAQRVAEIGREAIVFPLLDIQPLSDQTRLSAVLRDVERYAMVAFVSPNAIDAAFAIRREWPEQVAIAVVGEGSRAALAQYGITSANATIISPTNRMRTDSQTLLEVLDVAALAGKRVLIVRGETGRELLADALLANGIEVEKIAAYRRIAPVLDDAGKAQLRNLLERGADWVITSSEALRILMQMVEEVASDDGVAKMQQQNIIVPHVRIAETAQSLGFAHVVQTGSGDEHILAALQFRA
jgi:uroporphyrinogen-III synthase